MNNLQPDTRIHNPSGVRINSAIEIDSSAESVWGVVGDFGGFHAFIPALECTQLLGKGLGQVRCKTFKDGGLAIEQLNTYDAPGMCMTWTLIHTTLPVGSLWAAMVVEPLGTSRSRATWVIQAEPAETGELQDPADFGQFLQGFADGAMGEVKRLLS
jgi:hypothetical protein